MKRGLVGGLAARPGVFRFSASALGLLLLAGGALADPVFPTGLGIGLTPPEGMTASAKFSGFEDEKTGAAILIVEMPPEAYAQIEKGLSDDALGKQGVSVAKRENFPVKDGKGFLVSGMQRTGALTLQKWMLVGALPKTTVLVTVQVPSSASGAYSDAVVRRALESVTYRSAGSLEEQMAALPFTLGDRAGFRVLRVLAGNSLLMTDGPKDVVRGGEQPIFIIAAGQGAIPGTLEQDRFARQALSGLAGVQAAEIKRAAGSERDRVSWHEIEAVGVDPVTKARLFVVQAIRFGANDYIRMVGMVREKDRAAVAARFARIRDGVAPR
ncbi:hypothetical protein QNA08_14740 [Chelatococcus sp. SYSU_G07232]|uniref:Uncharacterized protein n=1 Tax=Chelatococcus albus TaxID=3047466 RepID=A0ABT7AJD4_9HYPH|nr:hypothetical protein [Chelatococcus sp. SYSU_G07232]MDJ1159492.1 hypothetical protein [Chelatococcus sp. SYSU_G07232]